jgi:hypothetical protein
MAVATGPEAGFFVGRGVSVGSGTGVSVGESVRGISVPAGPEFGLQAIRTVVTITKVKRMRGFLFMVFFLLFSNRFSSRQPSPRWGHEPEITPAHCMKVP